MRRLLILGSVVIGLLLVIIAIVPFLVPTSVYRDRIETAAETALGRQVAIEGDIKLKVFPRIEAVAGSATISNPDGFGDDAFAEMSQLRAAVRLMPLFSRKVEIAEFVLVDPTINLIQTRSGENNWTFATNAKPPANEDAPASGASDLQASLGDVRLINGRISFEDRQAGVSHLLEGLNITAGMDALDKPLTLKGDGALDGLGFEVSATLGTLNALLNGQTTDVVADLSTNLATAKITGDVTLAQTPIIALDFDASAPDVVKLADHFDITDLPLSGALKSVTAKGRAEGQLDNLVVTIASLDHKSDLLAATASGVVNLGKSLTFDTKLEANISDIAAIASMANVEAPAASSLGKASIVTNLAGSLDDLRATNIDFSQSSNQLRTSFKGAARIAKDITFDGDISIASDDLKTLANSAGALLPEGDVYRNFSLSGAAKGSLAKFALAKAELAFDDLSGTGDMTLNMSGAIPRLTGALSLGAIDITPYVVASGGAKSEEQAKPSGWPTEPLNLDPLNAIEADLQVSASNLKYQNFDLGQSLLAVTIRNGKLTADIKETALYGGLGTAQIIADASGETPLVGLTANLNGMNIKPFLNAAANFGWVDGNGGLKLTLAGQGASMDAIMKSLTGSGSFNIDKGAVSGVNIPQIMALAKTALGTGSFADVLSADQETGFSSLGASFDLTNGIASTQDLAMILPQINVPGQGQLDIGNQKLALNLAPKSGNKSLGLNGFAPPIRVSGSWGNPLKPTLDFDAIKGAAVSAVTDLARDELAKKLTEQGLPTDIDPTKALKPGTDGNEDAAIDLLRNVFGNKKATPSPTPAPTPTPTASPTPAISPSPEPTPEQTPEPDVAATPTPEPSETPQTLEDVAKDELKKALGGIFD